MSYGAYFATEPSTRTYVDTSQGLMGDDLLAIYDGVAGLGQAPGCGCAGKRGSLRGFGNEVLPDGGSTEALPGVTQGTNVQTALVALLAVASVVAIGVAIFGSKPMRANGRRRPKRRMRRNGSPTKKRTARAAKRGASYVWRDTPAFSYLRSTNKKKHVLATLVDAGSGWGIEIDDGINEVALPRRSATRAAAKARVEQMLEASHRRSLRRNGAEVPAYLLKKKGPTTKRQSHAAAHYLAETRWGGNRKKKVAKWSGKHLAHYRFRTNAAR